MKKLIGFAVILVALFLSNSVFAQAQGRIPFTANFQMASKDEVKKDGDHYFTWEEAVAACDNSTVDGKKDWRLPSGKEINIMCKKIYKDGVVRGWDGRYWSSTKYRAYDGFEQEWFLGKESFIRVRCVRSF